MKYRIGDVSKVLGLTPGALRYYESAGLIRDKRATTGYRYYDVADLWRLLSYEKYHSMGCSVKEVIDQFTGGGSIETIEDRVRKRRDEALEKARKYNELAGQIEEHLTSIGRIDELLGGYSFERNNEMLFFCDDVGGWISNDDDKRVELNKWVRSMPAARLSFKTRAESPESGAVLGFSISASHPQSKNLASCNGVERIPSMSCLHTIDKFPHDFIYNPALAFKKALDYAGSRGLVVCASPVGTILLVETGPGGLFFAYVDIWIPIK